MIQVTQKAKDYLLTATKNSNEKYATFTVKGGGCSGFTYDWQMTSEIKDPEEWIEVNLSDDSDNKLMINKLAEMYVLGSTIDYVVELGGSFLAVKNPQATASCGCGESFAV
jgi:iron-sulfur cluster assembly accessory protein